MRIAAMCLFALVLAGCGEQVGRYQIAPNASGTVWRVDTKTGVLAICGFEIPGPRMNESKFSCTDYPLSSRKTGS